MTFETNIGNMAEEEKGAYVDIVKKKNGGTLEGVTKIVVNATEDEDAVNLSYETKEPFERIRRVNC